MPGPGQPLRRRFTLELSRLQEPRRAEKSGEENADWPSWNRGGCDSVKHFPDNLFGITELPMLHATLAGCVGWPPAVKVYTANEMGKNTQSGLLAPYPHLWRWVTNFGTVEVGHCHCPQTRSFIRVLDEGGVVWKGHRSYRTLDAALTDAEAGVSRWMKNELGATDAT